MFKTNDLYELISWLLLSLVWFGKGIPRTTVSMGSAQNKGICSVENVTKETMAFPSSLVFGESRPIKNEVWFYGEALALSRNKQRKSNERRRKEDQRLGAEEVSDGQ